MKNLFILFILLVASVSTYAQTETEERKVYTFVEEMPKFPGGDEAMFKFIQQNIKYPVKERQENIEGKVLLRFIINEDGSVSDITVVRSVSEGLDEEAARIIRMLPNFTPGKQNGKPVAVYYNLPFVFKL